MQRRIHTPQFVEPKDSQHEVVVAARSEEKKGDKIAPIAFTNQNSIYLVCL